MKTIRLSKCIKYLLLFTSIAVFAIPILIPGRQTLAQTSSDFLTYKDPKFGYSIEYPSDWGVFYLDSEPSNAYISTGDKSVVLYISVNSSIEQSMTIEDWGKKIVDVTSFNNPNAIGSINLNTNDYHVAGHPAARVEMTSKIFNPVTGETQQRIVTLVSIIDGKGYQIVFSAPDAMFSNYAATFGHMLYSFKVNG